MLAHTPVPGLRISDGIRVIHRQTRRCRQLAGLGQARTGLPLQRGFELQLVDHFLELIVRFVALRFGVANCLAQRFELRFLIIKLLGVALQEGFFFGAASQGFHIFAQPALIFHDAVDIFLPIFHFVFEFGDHRFLVHDFLQRLRHLGRDGLLFTNSSI